jgi:hypothetical protein
MPSVLKIRLNAAHSISAFVSNNPATFEVAKHEWREWFQFVSHVVWKSPRNTALLGISELL